jgi:hypothetical protein
MATIDTLALAERLEREYGDDPERARRHARTLGDMAAASDVATKQDIKDLHIEIGQLRTEMHEMEGRLRIEMQSEGNKLRAELHREIAAVRGEVGSLAWKVAGLLVAQAAVIIALIRLLPGGTQ